MPCKMDDINRICKEKNIVLIEDSAETIVVNTKKENWIIWYWMFFLFSH